PLAIKPLGFCPGFLPTPFECRCRGVQSRSLSTFTTSAAGRRRERRRRRSFVLDPPVKKATALPGGAMAIVIRFNVVVFAKASIEECYPGGLGRFRSDWTGSAEDEHLIAFSDMARHCIEDALAGEPLRNLPAGFGHAWDGIVRGGDWLSWAEWSEVT